MGFGGAALKTVSTALRAVEFLAAIAILGIFSYFLVYLREHDLEILTFVRAVEGISGAAALYTLVAFFLTCCLGGVAIFAFIGIALDLAFTAAFVATAVLTRGGLTNCSALPQGSTGLYSDSDVSVSVDHDSAKRICDMYKGTFAISVILIVLFLLSAIFQFFIGKHHQHEKRQSKLSAAPVSQPLWRRRFGRRGRRGDVENGAVPVTNY